MVLHIDMDAFFASIEQAVNPRLKDKPLIVGSRADRMHTVVCAASYEAKALGIHSGMPSRDAFMICPGIKFVLADQSKYIWTSQQILGLLKVYGLPLRYVSIDEFQLCLGNNYQDKNAVSLTREIKKQIYANFNITASAGIARTPVLAKLASKLNKPDGLTLINEENFKEILRKAPLNKLYGMAGKRGVSLSQKGIETCWDLYIRMPGFFNENPGKSDEISESLGVKPKYISHSYTLPRLEINVQVIRAWIRLLSEMVGERLRGQGLSGKTVHLWLSGPEIGGFGAQKTAQIATNDSYEIYLKCLKIMARMARNRLKVRVLGVSVSGLVLQDSAFLLIEERRREALTRAFDRINNRLGQGTIYPAQLFSIYVKNRRLGPKNPGNFKH